GSYSGSTTIVPTSATLTGWLGGPAPTIASATVANANVGAAGNYVTSLSDGTPTVLATSTSGSTPFVWNGSSINPNYYLSGSANAGAGTSLNALTLNPALLGIALDATYNGTTSFTASSAATNTTAGTIGTNGGTLTVTGLQGTDTVTGVVVNDANVDAVNAGSNYVASISGANTSGANGASTFAASNYALYAIGGAVARNVSVAGTPSAITSANNTASITPAPLGIAAAPTYNGTTSFTTTAPGVGNATGSVSSGGTVTVAGLVGGQTLAGFTLANANVVGSNQVAGVSITGGIDPRNYVLDGSSFGAGSAVTAGTQSNASNATNLAAVAAQALGIDVLGTYNGSTSLTADGSATLTTSNAVIQANGLVGGQTITGVTIASPNVAANGSNAVTGVTGGNGFDPANYALGNSQIVTGTTAFDGTQTGTPAATTNAVWLRPAPLGVAVSGTYNGSNVMTTAGGASIVASGLVGQDANASLTSATLASANVNATGNKVTAVAGSGSFAMSNYVLDGAPNSTTGLTSGAALDGSGATNSAAIAQAALGLDVLAVYNGTTQLSADGSSNLTPANAVVQANGLVGGQMITGLTISSANVSGNGSNVVTGATGTNGFDIANYRLGSGQTLADGSAFAGTQAGAGPNTGAVWLKPAPLGVAVAGTYNGSNVMTTATGAVIAVSGLVGQDAGATMTSATLTSNTGGAVLAVTGSGSFDMSNYVLAGAPNPTPTLSAGSALDGSAATNQAVISPFAPPPPPPSPIVVPAFVDNGAAALASTAPTAFGGLNYVAAGSLPTTGAQDAALAGGTQAPAAPGSVAAADPAAGAGSGLTYVSKATGADGGKRRSASELNVNNVTVPSASGPLDVFVVNTGINLLGVQALHTLGN
ncbi:MAG: hypothetical protein KGI35_07640, partial [Burkholderiales bacterium]|nr:hypothetical protein [Burkholderiales bacterium]